MAKINYNLIMKLAERQNLWITIYYVMHVSSAINRINRVSTKYHSY